MTVRNLFLLPGDGIGPEAMAEVRKIIAYMNAEMAGGFTTDEGLVGGSAYDAHGAAISDADMAKAMAADAVLFGAVGGPKWDDVPYDVRPRPACCACARTCSCLPTCARRSATRRFPMRPR
jgi:3-isopropylmalate dehydrogenase